MGYKKTRYRLPAGTVKICIGIMENYENGEPLTDAQRLALAHADETICKHPGGGELLADAADRENLCKALRLALINRKENPFETLANRYRVAVGKTKFSALKRRYVWLVAEWIR